MDNRDNLEKYIKEQVESIEFHEADKMWQNFSENYTVPTGNSPYLFWALGIVLVSSLLYVAYSHAVFDHFISESETKNSIELNRTQESINKENLSNDRIISSAELEVTTIERIENSETEIIQSEKVKESIEDLVVQLVEKEINNLKDKQRIDDSLSVLSENTKQYSDNVNSTIAESTTRTAVQKSNSDGVKTNTIKSADIQKNTGDLNTSNSPKNYPSQPIDDIHQMTEEIKNTSLTGSNKNISEDKFDNRAGTTFLLEYKKVRQLENKLDEIGKAPLLDSLANAIVKNVLKKYPIRIELHGATSQVGINDYSIGFSYQFEFQNGNTFTFGTGLQYSDGYSVSQDSLFREISLSITELRKNKDLDYLLDVNLSASYDLQWNNFQFSLGGKAKYGIQNRFQIIEIRDGINLQDFNSSSGRTIEYFEKSDWSALNRWRFDAFGELTYKVPNRRFEVGLTVSRQINSLIDFGIAPLAPAFNNHINTPFQFGAHVKLPFSIY